MIVSKILREFDKKKDDYEVIREKARKTLEAALKANNISFHKIESRVKQKKQVEDKIIRKNYKYASINDLTDLVGLRVIVLYEDEVSKVAGIVRNIFKVDAENSIDRTDFIDPEKFGYRSFHYVATFKKGVQRFEIQIRTILQHAWAELSHKLGYKSEIEIPRSNLREFSRLSGLLEVGDFAFIKLRNDLENYAKDLKPKSSRSLIKLDVNKESIRVFINQDDLITTIDKVVVNRLNGTLMPNDFFDDELKVSRYFGLNTLSQLKSLISRNKNRIIESAIRIHSHLNERKVAKGVGIMILGYILADRKGSDDEILNLLNKIEILPPADRKSFSITLHNKINYK